MHAQNAAIFPPNGGKPYLEVLSRFDWWRVFLNNNIQATTSASSAFWLVKKMSVNPKSVQFHQCHAKPHRFAFFTTISKLISSSRFVENTDSVLKVDALYYANALLVRVILSFQKLLQTRSTCRNNTKKCLGKEYWRVLVVDKSTDDDKLHFNLFFNTLSTSKKTCFFQSASWNGIARHIDPSSVVWTLIDNGKLDR